MRAPPVASAKHSKRTQNLITIMTTKTRKTYGKRKPSAAAQARRLELCEKSKAAKMILQNIEMLSFDDPLRECEKVNDVLMHWHGLETQQTNPDCWNIFKGWKELGYSVCKGEKGFLIWGKPRKMKGRFEAETKDGSIEEIEKEFSAFPLCYLFHAGQVQDGDGGTFDATSPFILLALAPKKAKHLPLCLPAPEADTANHGHFVLREEHQGGAYLKETVCGVMVSITQHPDEAQIFPTMEAVEAFKNENGRLTESFVTIELKGGQNAVSQ